jgi:hypothetical protein
MIASGHAVILKWIYPTPHVPFVLPFRKTAGLRLPEVLQFRQFTITSGSNSVVESRLPKPLVAGSIPVSRSKLAYNLLTLRKPVGIAKSRRVR